MDPLNDLDRAIREAMYVEPGAHFTARIRARVGETSTHSRMPVTGFALASMAAVVVTVVSVSFWEAPPVAEVSIVPSRNLLVVAPASSVLPSPATRPPSVTPRERAARADVLVSQSEMLALQRLFAGITVAPPPLPVPTDELSIPKLEIEPLPPLAGGLEGERQ